MWKEEWKKKAEKASVMMSSRATCVVLPVLESDGHRDLITTKCSVMAATQFSRSAFKRPTHTSTAMHMLHLHHEDKTSSDRFFPPFFLLLSLHFLLSSFPFPLPLSSSSPPHFSFFSLPPVLKLLRMSTSVVIVKQHGAEDLVEVPLDTVSILLVSSPASDTGTAPFHHLHPTHRHVCVHHTVFVGWLSASCDARVPVPQRHRPQVQEPRHRRFPGHPC